MKISSQRKFICEDLLFEFGIFFLAEVQAVVQLLQHHQLRPLGRTGTDALLQALDIVLDIGRAVLLHHTHFQCSHILLFL